MKHIVNKMCDCSVVEVCINEVCKHKDLFPITYHDGILTIVIFAAMTFATVAGIGFGALISSVYLLIGGFNIDDAIPLTVITISGSALIRVLFLFNKKHPIPTNRYLINFGIIIIINCFDTNSAFIGLILNTILPSWSVMLSIIVILSIINVKTFIKARRLYKAESKRLEQTIQPISIDGLSFTVASDTAIITVDGIDVPVNMSEQELEEFREKTGDEPIERYHYIAILVATLLLMTMFTVVRQDHTEKCGIAFWMVYFVQFIVFTVIGGLLIKYNIYVYEKRKQNNYRFVTGDLHWNYRSSMKYSIVATLTGVISTFLGIGGGILIGPFLLSLGMSPVVVASTDSVTTFFSAVSSSIQYISAGRILPYYSIYMFIISGIASILGLKISSYIVRHINRQSIIVFILGALITISIISLCVVGINEVINDGISMEVNDFCNSETASH